MDLVLYLQAYVKLFSGNELPDPQSPAQVSFFFEVINFNGKYMIIESNTISFKIGNGRNKQFGFEQ